MKIISTSILMNLIAAITIAMTATVTVAANSAVTDTAGVPLKALVTGGNRGIGLEVVKILCRSSPPHSVVFMGCRDVAAGERVLASNPELLSTNIQVIPVQIDVTSIVSIRACKDAIEKDLEGRHRLNPSAPPLALDILINNSGIMPEADNPGFSSSATARTLAVNFDGLIAVTRTFLPLLLASSSSSPSPAKPEVVGGRIGRILSTSSGVGARTLGLLSEEHRARFQNPSLNESELRALLSEIVDALDQNPEHPYHRIPTIGYGLSKLGVNVFTQMLAREYPVGLEVNVCSPGFTKTGISSNYTGSRLPKDAALGASVFEKVLFGDLGKGQTARFFKETSKPGTALEEATACVDPWVQ